jgi:hypothetical protein
VENLPDGRLTISITQTAKAKDLIVTHGMEDCNPVASPYRSGFVIDRIIKDGVPVEAKAALVTKLVANFGSNDILGMISRQPYLSSLPILTIQA